MHVAYHEFLLAANQVLSERGEPERGQILITQYMAPCAFLCLLPMVGRGFSTIFLLLYLGFLVQAYKVGVALANPPRAAGKKAVADA